MTITLPNREMEKRMTKHAMLLEQANQRKQSRWDGYHCLGEYHCGVYECNFVSPYTKTGCNQLLWW